MPAWSRRALLAGGVVAAGAAVGGGLWRAVDQGVFATGQGPAFEPWRTWEGRPDEGALALVRAAILAANPHNSQPWLFRVGAERVDLFADPRRGLGAIDPLRREMDIGLGCALENLTLSAAAHGFAPRADLLPAPDDPTHVAAVSLARGARIVSDLYRAIPTRHTDRGPFAARAVDPAARRALEAAAAEDGRLAWFTTAGERARIGAAIVAATEAIIGDREQSAVTPAWLRFRWRDVQTRRDGLTIDTNLASPLLRALAKMAPAVSPERGDEYWLAATRDTVVPTAAGFGILTVRDPHDRRQRLAGGRAWQRLQLAAATHGLALQPLSQMTERADREESTGAPPRFSRMLEALVGDAGRRALMTFRFGYPVAPAALSPRRPVEWVLVQAG